MGNTCGRGAIGDENPYEVSPENYKSGAANSVRKKIAASNREQEASRAGGKTKAKVDEELASVLGSASDVVAVEPCILSIDTVVEHYQPPTFPMMDIVTEADLVNCRMSWKSICKQAKTGNSLLVTLIDEFYFRLFRRNQRFEKIFSNVGERASVLAKAMNFLLTRQPNAAISQQRFTDLGRLHRQMGLPLHFYSTYVETLLESLAFVLGPLATISVMESWVRTISYTLRRLMKNVVVLEDVRKLEYAVNTSNDVQLALKARQDDEKAAAMERRIREGSELGSQLSAMSGTSNASGSTQKMASRPEGQGPSERKPFSLGE